MSKWKNDEMERAVVEALSQSWRVSESAAALWNRLRSIKPLSAGKASRITRSTDGRCRTIGIMLDVSAGGLALAAPYTVGRPRRRLAGSLSVAYCRQPENAFQPVAGWLARSTSCRTSISLGTPPEHGTVLRRGLDGWTNPKMLLQRPML